MDSFLPSFTPFLHYPPSQDAKGEFFKGNVWHNFSKAHEWISSDEESCKKICKEKWPNMTDEQFKTLNICFLRIAPLFLKNLGAESTQKSLRDLGEKLDTLHAALKT
ncbi:MAG TPA: hypothetical protein VLE95_06540 [Chlamydiales bacterium]|nr:hypothetical protein [Chlamydiales bacterium]